MYLSTVEGTEESPWWGWNRAGKGDVVRFYFHFETHSFILMDYTEVGKPYLLVMLCCVSVNKTFLKKRPWISVKPPWTNAGYVQAVGFVKSVDTNEIKRAMTKHMVWVWPSTTEGRVWAQMVHLLSGRQRLMVKCRVFEYCGGSWVGRRGFCALEMIFLDTETEHSIKHIVDILHAKDCLTGKIWSISLSIIQTKCIKLAAGCAIQVPTELIPSHYYPWFGTFTNSLHVSLSPQHHSCDSTSV